MIMVLSMGIAVAIAVLSTSGPVSMHRQHIHQRERILVFDVLDLYGREALGILSEKGPETARNFCNEMEKTLNIRCYIFSEDGAQITGQQAPPVIRRMVYGLSPGTPSEIERNFNQLIAAQIFSGPDSKKFKIACELLYPPNDPFDKHFPFPGDFGLRLLLSFLLCGTICYFLARHLTIPIKNLRTATQKVANGDLSVRVSPAMGRRKDEIANLGKDFDRMTEQVENLLESQKRLLRDISHELRSPLARLTIALELARQRAHDPVFPALDRIGLETERLNDLIGQLLTLTKLESGTGRKEETMDLSQIIRKIATDAGFEAQSRNITVQLDSPESLSYSGYPEMLHSAIENVVRNSVRYTHDNTRILISLEQEKNEGSWINIHVRDQGHGVPDSDLPHLFKAFYRVADARDRQSGGMGLGLAIAERSINLHNGSITAQNDTEHGFVVTIRLPQ